MSTAPVTAAPHVSWLKKFGQEILKGLGFIEEVIEPVEKVAEPIIESLVPASAPIFNLADELFTITATGEAAYNAASDEQTGPQKLAAAAPFVEQALVTYAADKFPGYAYIPPKATIDKWTEAMVALLNDIPATVQAKNPPTLQASLAAGAVKAVLSPLTAPANVAAILNAAPATTVVQGGAQTAVVK